VLLQIVGRTYGLVVGAADIQEELVLGIIEEMTDQHLFLDLRIQDLLIANLAFLQTLQRFLRIAFPIERGDPDD
jgi:hypothetical protein